MNYALGGSLVLVGTILAHFSDGNSQAAWITLGVLLIGWSAMALYLIGVRHGRRHSDD